MPPGLQILTAGVQLYVLRGRESLAFVWMRDPPDPDEPPTCVAFSHTTYS